MMWQKRGKKWSRWYLFISESLEKIGRQQEQLMELKKVLKPLIGFDSTTITRKVKT